MGRAFGAAADALQSVLGRVPLRYSFAVTPVSIGGLPSDVTAVSLVWEKGNSVCYTSDAPVSPVDGTAVFSEVMHQTATVFKHGNTLLPKCYTLKIQAVSNTAHQDTASTKSASTSTTTTTNTSNTSLSPGEGSRRRTVARARIDLAQFCAAQTTPSTTDAVLVPLEPQGTLVLSIKTVWLQHYDRTQASASASAQQRQLVVAVGGDEPPRRSFAQIHSWGSSTASDDQAYEYDNMAAPGQQVSCTLMGEDGNRDALNTGSAELDRLLEEAEAATAAKTIAPSAAAGSSNSKGAFSSIAAATTPKALSKTRHNSQQQQQPKVVVSLAALSSTNGPRGPKKHQPHSPFNSAGAGLVSLQQQQQQQQPLPVRTFMAMLSMPSSGGYSSNSSGSGGGSSSSYCSSNASSSTCEDSNSSCSSSFATSSFAVGSSGSKKWHRRASSVPETPTIPESEGEGPDSGSFSAQEVPASAAVAAAAAAAQGSAQQQQQGSALLRDARQHGQLSALLGLQQARGSSASIPMPFGLSTDGVNDGYDDGGFDAADSDADSDAAVCMDASPSTCRAAALAGASATASSATPEGPEALRSLSGRMPTWLWPSSRLAVRDLTTDEIMRRISSSRDVAALQGMCRGLLCERNDWRFRATQAERANISLQQELQQLRESEAAAHRQLQEQQTEAQLVQQLVDAKLQLAQADLTQADLRGQLERKKRHMQALKAKLTALQHQFDSCVHEQQQVLNGV